MRFDVAVIGSGVGGSLLARLLALRGRRVLLLERGSHPRFALGESSTPLAAIALERLAERYGQPDLRDLAAHGRWIRRLPSLRCGLKRGFSFYDHHGAAPDLGPSSRFLVAASPNADVADCQWMRSDVDEYLMRAAVAAGAEYQARTEILEAMETDEGLRLVGTREGAAFEVEAGFVVDASGAGGALARTLPIADVSAEIPFSSELVYGHFDGVERLGEEAPFASPHDPYPQDWSAAHHLFDGGWMYLLRFDDGRVSAGLVLDSDSQAVERQQGRPEQTWARVLSAHPFLWRLFEHTVPVEPGLRRSGRLQRRLAAAVGDRWALLPQTYAFYDPLFSTGLAWSLVCVERLADLLGCDGEERSQVLARYGALVEQEADHQQRLIEVASRSRSSFESFRSTTFLYFVAASFNELRQRLVPYRGAGQSWAWDGFLGATHSGLRDLFIDAGERLDDRARAYGAWVQAAIEPYNLVGIGERSDHLYGVDLDCVVERCDLLELDREEMVALLPRLRGTEEKG